MIEFGINGLVLLQALKGVEKAVSKEESRYTLNGLYFEPGNCKGELISITTTDGHRLSNAVAELTKPIEVGIDKKKKPGEGAFGFILYLEDIKDIIRLLSKKGNETNEAFFSYNDGCLEFFEKKIDFRYKNYSIGLKCIDGIFPDWRKVVPNKKTKKWDGKNVFCFNPVERRINFSSSTVGVFFGVSERILLRLFEVFMLSHSLEGISI